jgi:abortive infection bacteriophage resistance protein
MKHFLTYHKQVRLLKERNLIIDDESTAIKILSETNYYNLINGYKYPFIQDSDVDKFIEGTKIIDIHNLYKFDKKLSSIILMNILKIENTIKSYVAYEFSKHHGTDDFLKIENFNSNTDNNKKAAAHLISDIHLEFSKNLNKDNKYISHFTYKYGKIPPLWVLVKTFTFGNISSFYSCMKQNESANIAKKFINLHDHQLRSFLKFITLFRNACAHDERIYCLKARDKICDYNLLGTLNVPKASGGYVDGKNNILALLICFKVLLNKENFLIFKDDFTGLLNSLSFNSIKPSKIYKEMGLIYEWKNIFN